MAQVRFFPQHAKYVMNLEYNEAHEPDNREHQTNLRNSSESRSVHGSTIKCAADIKSEIVIGK
jgi:hypothetical protein